MVKSVKGLFRKTPGVIHQNIDGSKVFDCCFDSIGSSLLLADIAIDANQAAGGCQLLIGVTRCRDDVITFLQKARD
jgi:hypothetical protein